MDDKWTFKFRKAKPVEGEPMTLEEAERYLLAKLDDPDEDLHKARLEIVQFYVQTHRGRDAMPYAEAYLAECADPGEKAQMCFHQGQLMEQVGEWESAIKFYLMALEMGAQLTLDRYFLHNNLGYSLNQLGRFYEAAAHLREAIRLGQGRANAFKNLGLSLEGQNKLAEAARSYIAAVRANASDDRALMHIEDLAERHKELFTEISDLEDQISKCRGAVESAKRQQYADPNRIH